MRNPHRIPTLLDIFSRETVKESYLKNVVGIASKSDINKFLARWKQAEERITEFWKEYPDLRMSQVLISVKVLPNFSGSWFNTEDEKFMKQCGIADERLTTVWVKVDGDLPERGIPVKGISDKDLYFMKGELGDDLPQYLQREIDFRQREKIKVAETNNPYYVLDID